MFLLEVIAKGDFFPLVLIVIKSSYMLQLEICKLFIPILAVFNLRYYN